MIKINHKNTLNKFVEEILLYVHSEFRFLVISNRLSCGTAEFNKDFLGIQHFNSIADVTFLKSLSGIGLKKFKTNYPLNSRSMSPRSSNNFRDLVYFLLIIS